ncbi:hypothetical protein [Lonsdalea quercina]|uniref:hypothetical protein n=1 Tax=Lonsdalea quercina TaxID=71657 RepID=UPI0039766DE0
MMKVDSFIKNGDDFVNVNEFKGRIKKTDYIDGAILLTINYVEVMNTSMWDCIDQLWIYMLNALIELNSGKDAEFYFPDQPIKVTLNHVKNNILFKVGDVGVVVEKKAFMLFMANSCLNFLESMMTIDGAPDYGLEIKSSLSLIHNLTS